MTSLSISVFGLLLFAAGGEPPDPDADGDGISDFREVHKHGTDPAAQDSDGDGKPDGEADERREYAYTVRAVMRVLPPIDADSLTDDFQDGRVLRKTADYVEIEVVHYPFGTANDAIAADPDWRKHLAPFRAALAAGTTTNFDAKMQRDLRAALLADGIDQESLTDRDLVLKLSKWLMQRAEFEDSFTTFAAEFARGKPRIAKGLESNVRAELARRGRTLEAQWDRELFGKGMYENRIRGSCTSSAIYLATGLRAAGLPARTVICLPLIDASDPAEVALARERLTHHRVRDVVLRAAAKAGNSWNSHTFNEVVVGGRWRRLNYDRLGQDTLDADSLGLMTHVNTFLDHAEAGLHTWGLRAAEGGAGDAFGHSNPYSCIDLDDRFGAHSEVSNLPVEAGLRELEIRSAYWFFGPDKVHDVQMTVDGDRDAGHLVVHCDVPQPAPDRDAVKAFWDAAPRGFELVSPGQQEVRAEIVRGYWYDAGSGLADFYLRVEPSEFSRMKRGVPYHLAALDSSSELRWRVRAGVSIVRTAASDAAAKGNAK